MTETELLLEAAKRGFGNATKIIPTLNISAKTPPIVLIPEGTQIRYAYRNLFFFKNGSAHFPAENYSHGYWGVIYSGQTKEWAIIKEKRESTSIIPLTSFPKTGMCWKPTQELLDYLRSRESTKNSGQSINIHYATIHQHGLVWNENNIWTVSTSSSYKEYSIEELMRYIPSSIPDHVKHYPLIPEECNLPEKWFICINEDNSTLIQEFLVKHNKEYVRYNNIWKPQNAIGSLFCYPQQVEGTYCLFNKTNKDYVEITTDQFIKHVLTHTDKQQQINESSKTEKDEYKERQGTSSSCKIPRSNITIRDTAPIRGVGLKCPKIQIKVGSGYLPD